MSRRALTALILVLVALAAVSFFLLRGAKKAPAAGANLLLVTLDTFRADRLGARGLEPSLTPNLDALAATGLRFEEALSSVPLTLPSHASRLTVWAPVGAG